MVWLFFLSGKAGSGGDKETMNHSLARKVENYIRERELLQAGDTVCIAFSGGADSLCLLLLLRQIRDRIGCRLCAVHVNHGLRGRESDADEQFVRQVCRENGIPVRVFHCDAAAAAAALGCSVEEAGRLLRQEAWRCCMQEDDVTKMALAHHRNDQAETMLFRAARGTSLGGLAGIRPVQQILPLAAEVRCRLAGMLSEWPEDGSPAAKRPAADGRTAGRPVTIIRPLLCAGRDEIEAHLTARGCRWQTDHTNLEDTYARNGIRHRVIPWLEEHINPAAAAHLAELAGDLAETDAFLRDEARRRSARYVRAAETDGPGCLRISGKLLADEPPVMRRYILMDALRTAAGSASDLGREQIRQLEKLLSLPAGRQADLPYGLTAVRDAAGLLLGRDGRPEGQRDGGRSQTLAAVEIPFPPGAENGEADIWFGGWRFHLRILRMEECPDPIPRKQYTKWLDYGRIEQNLAIRARQPGDWLAVLPDGGKKKLKEYLIDSKIPRDSRDAIPLLASGQEVFWIAGHRISEAARVRDNTERVLEITADCPTGSVPSETGRGPVNTDRQENTDE